jgi:putative inorganic carbon (HCO3(-)) transporter
VAFVLFLLVNAALFIRPGELFQDWADVPVYQMLIICCALAALPAIADQLRPSALRVQPITVCVLGMAVAIELSFLYQFKTWEARLLGYEFAKVVLYYLLLVGLLSTPRRYRLFLLCLLGGITILTALALLQYFQFIDLPALAIIEEKSIDPVTGDTIILPRLRSTGIFNDPNDLCLILVLGIGIAGCRWEESKSGQGILWLVPAAFFVYALSLTQSRGGLLGFLAGLLVFTWQRYGGKRAIGAALVLLPVMLLLFAGRQTKFDTSEGTAQDRIQLWSAGLGLFRQAPVFGIGMDNFFEEVGLVAHNSFVHCYAELGFVGGTIFLGIYYMLFTTFARLRKQGPDVLDPELARLQPYLMAVVVAQFVGMLSLSRPYVVSTYIMLGLSTAYFNLVTTPERRPLPAIDRQLVGRLALVSVVFLAAAYTFVRTFAHFG